MEAGCGMKLNAFLYRRHKLGGGGVVVVAKPESSHWFSVGRWRSAGCLSAE